MAVSLNLNIVYNFAEAIDKNVPAMYFKFFIKTIVKNNKYFSN